MIDPADLLNLGYLYGIATPAWQSGCYYQATPSAAVATSATLGVGVVRVTPMAIQRSVSLVRIGAEVTSAGDAGSTVRLGIWSDLGGYPGALVLDAGTISGDSATVQEITITLTLRPGMYWVGAAVQGVTTTQPTIRSLSSPASSGHVPLTTGTLPAANAVPNIGYSQTSVPGAFSAAFTTSKSATGTAARIFVKTA